MQVRVFSRRQRVRGNELVSFWLENHGNSRRKFERFPFSWINRSEFSAKWNSTILKRFSFVWRKQLFLLRIKWNDSFHWQFWEINRVSHKGWCKLERFTLNGKTGRSDGTTLTNGTVLPNGNFSEKKE